MVKRKRLIPVGKVYKKRKMGRLTKRIMYPAPPNMRRIMRNIRTGGLLNKELKYKDYNKTATITNTWQCISPVISSTNYALNSLPQGTSATERIGNRVTVRSIQVNMIVSLNKLYAQTVAPHDQCVRIALVLDKQPNASTSFPIASEIWDNSGVIPVTYHRNIEYINRYKVLAERIMTLNYSAAHNDGAATGTYTGPDKPVRIFKKFEIPVQYKDTGVSLGAIQENAVHLFIVGTQNNVSTYHYTSRIRFTG